MKSIIIYQVKKIYYAKKWREDNLEYRKQYDKEYYEDNRRALIEKALVKVTCGLCGSVVCQNFMTAHKKTNSM